MSEVTVVGSYIVALVMDVDRLPLEGEPSSDGITTPRTAARDPTWRPARGSGWTRPFSARLGETPSATSFSDCSTRRREAPRRLCSDALPTAVGFIVFSARGTNLIVIDMGANSDFLPVDIQTHAEEIRRAEVSLSPLEIPLETAMAAARVAKAVGRKFILNPAPAADLRGHDLSCVFALTPNERESRVCLGLRPDDPISDHEAAQSLLALGVEHVMLTRGEKGVLWASHAGVQSVPALPVQVVDSVGAGDAFNAGLAVGLSESRPVLEAIALGVTAASLSTQHRETIESYYRRAEVNAHLPKVLQAAHAFAPGQVL